MSVRKANLLALPLLGMALLFTEASAADRGDGLFSPGFSEGCSYHPYPFSFSAEPVPSLSTNVRGLHLSPLRFHLSHEPGDLSTPLQGIKARYEMDLGKHRIEVSGGYVPGMKSLAHSETHVDSRAHVGFVNVGIPLFQFHLRGGAFFGQSSESFGLLLERPQEEPSGDRELLGYQIAGEYRFRDSLIIQAGWGRAAQAHNTTREDLRALYLQAYINLGWRMSIIPHVGFVDFTNENGEKAREEAFYCGAKWQINF